MDQKMGKTGNTKFIVFFFCFVLTGAAGNTYSAHYKTDRLWEIDSVLVAWLIKEHVDKEAIFSSIPRGERIEKKFSINTPYSPLRRNARYTAFDAAIRIYKVDSQCIDKIRPIIRVLEITPWRKHEYLEALKFEKALVPLLPSEPGEGNLEDAFSYINTFCNSLESSAISPDPIAFVSLIDDSWQIVTWRNNSFAIVKTQQEPRTFDHDFIHNQTVYIGSDKSVRLIKDKQERILLTPDKHAYTQPVFSTNGENIYLVKLIDGNSINTDIICLNLQSKAIESIVSQRSTQLEPFIANKGSIYYSNVSCVDGCGKIIQEIWHKNITANDANQLTLLNVIAHQPTVNKQGSYLFFSSNKDGYYHIWRMSIKTGEYKQLTSGAVTDSFPAVQSDGSVYFIRSLHGHNMLMKVGDDGSIQQINLPEKYHKIRELKVD